MKKLSPNWLVFLLAMNLGVLPGNAGDALQDVQQRLNKAAAEFQGMTAQVAYVTHTDVLNENTNETATVVMKKVQSGEVQGRVDFTSPDVKSVTFEKRKVQVFYPKINTLQVYDLDKQGEQIDKFLMIGFGTSGSELAKDYVVKVLGTETLKEVQNQPTVHLQLIPKAKEAKQYVSSLELWLPEQGEPYPIREKILQPSGDYRLVTYSDVKINPPNFKADALRLKIPAGVKTEYPGK